ncbi:MAG TPA: Ig-like domain-containing protein [Anaerolineae bacterium]|nr:Ig-like domain-containing protein [Anaerolineae bacterium]
MRRRTVSEGLSDVIRLVVAVVLLAIVIILALRATPTAVVSTPPVVTLPEGGSTVGADELPSLEGTADPGVTVQVFDGDTLLGETVAQRDGSFRFGLASALPEGTHNVRALALDKGGNIVFESNPVAFTVMPATELTAMPFIVSPHVAAGFTAGELPAFDGTASPGTTVRLYLDEAMVGETVVGSDGTWRIELSEALAAGTHALRAVTLDAEGNEGSASREVAFAVGEPALEPPSVNLSADASFAAGEELVFDGVAAPGSTLRIYDGETLLGETTAGADGHWRFEPEEMLSAGAHALRAVVLDSAGEEAVSSEAIAFTVEESVVVPQFATPGSGGSFAAGGVVTLDGTAAPGTTLRFYDGDSLLGEAVAGPDGRWSFELPEAPAPGPHALLAVALDAAGEESVSSAPFEFTVNEPVVVPSILSHSTDARIIAGEELAFDGLAAPGATVRVYDGRTLLGEAEADAMGRWVFELPQPLATGSHELRVVALDAAGEEGEASDLLAFAIVEPAIQPVILLPETGDYLAGETVDGTAAAAALVLLYSGEDLLGETTADGDGAWSFPLPLDLPAGEHTLRAVAVDEGGDPVAESEPVGVEVFQLALSPAPPTILAPEGGSVAAGDTMQGTATASALLQIFDGETLLGEVTSDADGNWSFRLPDDLISGEHTLRAVVVDEAGVPLAESEWATFDMLELRLPVTGGS